MVQLSRLLIRATRGDDGLRDDGSSADDDNSRTNSRKIPLSNNSHFVDDAADEESNCSAFDVDGIDKITERRRVGVGGGEVAGDKGSNDSLDFYPGFSANRDGADDNSY